MREGTRKGTEAETETDSEHAYVRWLDDVDSGDVSLVGGKNASLGEMIRALQDRGIRVPGGFATTARAYRDFVEANDLAAVIASRSRRATEDEDNDKDEAKAEAGRSLEDVGRRIRRAFKKATFPDAIEAAVRQAYRDLSDRYGVEEVDVAVRSSATAEDLPEASFAGQQETFLNVTGEDELLEACRNCFASLFTDRAIAYREEHGFDHEDVALSVGVQKMVRSDKAGSGVMFSIDTESGFPDVVVINAAWGLGENVVQGSVTPDEYLVFKPLARDTTLSPIIQKKMGEKETKLVYAKGGSHTIKNVDTPKGERRSFVLTDEEILGLARWGMDIEDHYETPMDMEWAKDGDTGELFVVQARPETVQSQKGEGPLKSYRLTAEEPGEPLVSGFSIGEAIASGRVRILRSPDESDQLQDGEILVTEMTDPDWVPVMKRAAGIVTDRGGRTSHAAIVSRELALPAIVGTDDATERLEDGQEITLSCAEGETGYLYEGSLDYEEKTIDVSNVPETRTRLMMNLASPAGAFRFWRLPADGIGLARMEFIINNIIQIHPLALVHYDDLEDGDARRRIRKLTAGYEDKTEYFVDHLARGIARIAASQYPNPVIVRMSDFKTNEYAALVGGAPFEGREENPMLGFRGASRYYSEEYRPAFDLECRAIVRVREELGLDNVVIMIPFCRTLEEADRVLEVLAENGLERGKKALEVYVMCEIPSNVILAEELAKRFDGFSIGSNDLTQLVLGIDRDSDKLAYLFDERDPAVQRFIAELIDGAHSAGAKVGICGQAPSEYPEFARFLVERGIDSISLSPDTLIDVKRLVAETETETESERRGSARPAWHGSGTRGRPGAVAPHRRS